MVGALRKTIGMRQVPEAAKATIKARRRKVGETLLDLSIGEILEDVIERLTTQLKLTKATLKSTREELRLCQESLQTQEKEHERVVCQIVELKERESEKVSERDDAKEAAKRALENEVSEMGGKQHVF